MFAYLRGKIEEITPTIAVIECAGVGYEVNISLNTYSAFQGLKEVKIFVTPIYRDDAQLLFGFATKEEQRMFALLISVSGVGANTARVILSSYKPHELSAIIATGQTEQIKAIKGIGLKTAQRIIVDLKGKINLDDEDWANMTSDTVNKSKGSTTQNNAEAFMALKALGYNDVAIRKVLRTITQKDSNTSVESIIKQALGML